MQPPLHASEDPPGRVPRAGAHLAAQAWPLGEATCLWNTGAVRCLSLCLLRRESPGTDTLALVHGSGL